MSTLFQTLIPQPESLPSYLPAFKLLGTDRYGNKCAVLIKMRNDGKVPQELTIRGLGADSVHINTSFADKDFFRPIMGTECNIEVVTKTYNLLFSLMRADDTKYLMLVYENYETINEKLIFQGFYRSDSYRQTWRKNKSFINLAATSGIGLLRYVMFTPPPTGAGYQGEDNEGPVHGEHKMAYVLSYLFYLSGNRADWYDMVPYKWHRNHNDENHYFEQPMQVAEHYGKTCLDVLEHIMAFFNTQVLMIDGHLAIRVMDDPATDHYRRYDYRGNYIDDVSTAGNILDTHLHFNNIRGDIKAETAYRRLIIGKQFDKLGNFLFNGDFKQGYKGWAASPQSPEIGFWQIYGTPYNYMTINTLNHIDYPEPEIYIRNMVNRGVPQYQPQGIRYQIRMDVSWLAGQGGGLPTTNTTLKTRLGVYVKSYTIKPDEWASSPVAVSFDYANSDALGEMGIYAVKAFGNAKIIIRNVRVIATVHDVVQGIHIDVENKVDEDIIEINENSLRDISQPITHFEGNQYAYSNRTPRTLMRRRDGGFISISEWLKQRYINYYTGARKRLEISAVLKDNVNISGLTLLRDHELNTTFVVSSIRYSPMRKFIDLDLIGYQDYLVDAPDETEPDPLWILALREWNDDGEWVDSDVWRDD